MTSTSMPGHPPPLIRLRLSPLRPDPWPHSGWNCFLATHALAAAAHYTGVFKLTSIVEPDNFKHVRAWGGLWPRTRTARAPLNARPRPPRSYSHAVGCPRPASGYSRAVGSRRPIAQAHALTMRTHSTPPPSSPLAQLTTSAILFSVLLSVYLYASSFRATPRAAPERMLAVGGNSGACTPRSAMSV